MKRDEILKSGTYSSIPNDILASKEIRPRAKLLYIALLDHLGDNLSVWPSEERLMIKTGQAKNTVIDGLADLEQAGFIAVDNSHKHKSSNVYILYDAVTAAERKASGQVTMAYKSRRQARNDGTKFAPKQRTTGQFTVCTPTVQSLNVQSLHPHSSKFAPSQFKVCTLTVQSLHPNSSKFAPEPPQEPQKEPLHLKPPKEPPQASGGLASQDANPHSTHTLADAPASSEHAEREDPSLPSEASDPACGAQASPDASGSQEQAASVPAAPAATLAPTAEIVKRMYEIAKDSGIEMPTGREEKRVVLVNLNQCVQERPLFKYMWGQLLDTLMARKKFSSKKLSWFANYKRHETTGEPVWNWQMIAHWIYDDATNCFHHYFEKHWHELCPDKPYFDSESLWDVLEATIGGKI
jgi:hypothetical protein